MKNERCPHGIMKRYARIVHDELNEKRFCNLAHKLRSKNCTLGEIDMSQYNCFENCKYISGMPVREYK